MLLFDWNGDGLFKRLEGILLQFDQRLQSLLDSVLLFFGSRLRTGWVVFRLRWGKLNHLFVVSEIGHFLDPAIYPVALCLQISYKVFESLSHLFRAALFVFSFELVEEIWSSFDSGRDVHKVVRRLNFHILVIFVELFKLVLQLLVGSKPVVVRVELLASWLVLPSKHGDLELVLVQEVN